MSLTELVARAEKNMQICNACRYCGGLLRGISRHGATPHVRRERSALSGQSVPQLQRPAITSCQYAPPHEFGVNVPHNFAQLRAETYKRYAWPGFLAGLFERNSVAVSLITAASLALVFC